MPNIIRDIIKVDVNSYSYIFEENVTVPLKHGGVLRCNVYRPRLERQYPVLVTCGPYGKDVPYKSFNPSSFSEIDPQHQTDHSAWETPTPSYWTSHGYVVVRADEPGIGQSPGILNVKSKATVDAFCSVVEWAAEQSWSSGKVGLLGVSYYAASQWQVAARNPRGLAACVPWEGFSDSYNESVRHGGILSNAFYQWWFKRQVASNQYGLAGKAARNWGSDTVEGDLSSDELKNNRVEILGRMRAEKYRDDQLFTETAIKLEDVTVPILSVANLGGIMLHLRGNVLGYLRASSEFKFLRFITGRHDLPFYYPEEVEVQRSFLDAFLKGEDRLGWAIKGALPPVSLLLRKGDVGYNNPEGEKSYQRREESQWPLASTQYTKFFLTPKHQLLQKDPHVLQPTKNSYLAYGATSGTGSISPQTTSFSPESATADAPSPTALFFETEPFSVETEITGHIVVHLNVSAGKDPSATSIPSDIDLFLSLRHVSSTGKEINYTGSAGEPVPTTKGWLRVSLRKTNPEHRYHRSWLPYRDYYSTDVQLVTPYEVYAVDVEFWPTNVVVEAGARLVLEVSSGDTAGTGFWGHTDPTDRSTATFRGANHIHFGPQQSNFITLPVIPGASNGWQ